jgi:DNA-directed RNA polymerase specialized sigma24 family protein
VLLAIRPTRPVPGQRPATQKREEHSMAQPPVCLGDDHPDEPAAEVMTRTVIELEPKLRRHAAANGDSRHADQAISALWPELKRELDNGADWAYCARGVCKRRIASRIQLRFKSRVHTERARDGRFVWLDAELGGDHHDGATLADQILAERADSEYSSSVEREALRRERGEFEGAWLRELARMTVAMRTAVLAYVDAAPYAEIAQQLGVTEVYARKLVSRGMKRLRAISDAGDVT